MFVKTRARKSDKQRSPALEALDVTRRVPAQERSRQRVERILEAAGQVFGEVGYDAATMEAVALRAETSIGSIYQFFPNKPAVFRALAGRYRDRTRALVDSQLKGPRADLPWKDLLDGAIDAFAAFHEQEPGFRAVWSGAHLLAELHDESEAYNRELAEQLEETIGSKLPGLRRPMRPVVATMIVEVMNAGLVFALRHPKRAKAILAETKTMLHRYLEPWERGPR